MKFEPEFKNALSQLPPKEKDKLLLRLLKRDLNLANQLYFELVSNDNVEDRRAKVEVHIKKKIAYMTERSYSLGYLLVDVRSLSGDITEHVKTTKDKYGDPSLNLLMLNELLNRKNEKIAQAKLKDAYTLSIYIIARVFKILMQIKTLHEDYLIEFEDALTELKQYISKNPLLMRIAISNGFDINWIDKNAIPPNIVPIHKDIRAKGLLK